ncbi:MAG: pimeloyl-ACP methyl ester carboxylesterase [Gammaproteobacteria bacterium]|jgi:pimeloyl-ACP methyl ester carboxylesterase
MTSITLQLSDSSYTPYGTLSYREADHSNIVRGDIKKRETLVLVHGVGMQSVVWGPQIDYFSQSMRVIALDMPGHGGSSPLPVGAELADYIDWLFAAITALDTGPINLAGHSMGALIAGGFAICHPNLTRRVAVMNGVHNRTVKARAAVEARSAEIDLGQVDINTPLTRWFDESEADCAAYDLVHSCLMQIDLEGYSTAYRAFARGDRTFAARWSEVTSPMLALTGDGDPNSTPEMSHAMAAAAINGHVEVINGHRHMLNLTASDAVNVILKTWLATPLVSKSNNKPEVEVLSK